MSINVTFYTSDLISKHKQFQKNDNSSIKTKRLKIKNTKWMDSYGNMFVNSLLVYWCFMVWSSSAHQNGDMFGINILTHKQNEPYTQQPVSSVRLVECKSRAHEKYINNNNLALNIMDTESTSKKRFNQHEKIIIKTCLIYINRCTTLILHVINL